MPRRVKEDATGGWDYWGGGSGQDANPKKIINSATLEMNQLLGS